MTTATLRNPADARISSLVEGWNELRSTANVNDYDTAVFFRDHRNNQAFYVQQGRNEQFKNAVNQSLIGITGYIALEYIKMLLKFPNDRDWINLGGLKTLRYLAGLNISRPQLLRLVQEAHDEADTRSQPITQGVVSGLARARGYNSRRGAPPQSILATKRNILAQFIVNNVDPDDVPWAVVEAMPRRLQTQYDGE